VEVGSWKLEEKTLKFCDFSHTIAPKIREFHDMGLQDWKVREMAKRQHEIIFKLSRQLPREELYSLTDQIRRSCRSVVANIAEAYAKRRYPLHMISKLTDADGENAETREWLQMMISCNYFTTQDLETVLDLNNQINKLLNYMIIHKDMFAFKL
jgi:four helix bundle protein